MARGLSVVSTKDKKRSEFPPKTGLWHKTLFGLSKGADNDMYLGISWYSPKTSCGVHYHDVSEIEYIVSGNGFLESGGKKYVLEPGVALYEPAGVRHNLTNTGDEPMCVLYAHEKSNFTTTNLTHGLKVLPNGRVVRLRKGDQ